MISVITPCKNVVSEGRTRAFHKMMSSLSNQTHQDFEHILVDSNSQDGTAELLKDYQKKGLIDVLVVEKDNNLHEAVNKGLKCAKGKYVHVMNTDDHFSSDGFFEKSVAILENQDIDFTFADRLIVKRNGTPSSLQKKDPIIGFFRMPFNWQTMVIKKEVYDALGPFDEKYEIASDFKFMMKLLLSEKRGHYFPEVLVHALDGGITTDREKCIEEVTQVLFETYGKKHGITLEECNKIYLRRISPELFQKIKKKIKNERIKSSLEHCFKKIQPLEKSGEV